MPACTCSPRRTSATGTRCRRTRRWSSASRARWGAPAESCGAAWRCVRRSPAPTGRTAWAVAMPDVYSIRHTSVEDYVEPIVHEVKVSRADLLCDLRREAKRAAYLALCGECWYVIREGIARADEIPAECGVLVATASGLEVARPARKRAMRLPFATWMALARAAPADGGGAEDAQAWLGRASVRRSANAASSTAASAMSPHDCAQPGVSSARSRGGALTRAPACAAAGAAAGTAAGRSSRARACSAAHGHHARPWRFASVHIQRARATARSRCLQAPASRPASTTIARRSRRSRCVRRRRA